MLTFTRLCNQEEEVPAGELEVQAAKEFRKSICEATVLTIFPEIRVIFHQPETSVN